MKKFSKQFLLLIAILMLTGCGKKQIKYEEDPKQTRLSPAFRLSGTWILEDYTFNGNSILELLKSKKNIQLGNIIVLDFVDENKDKGIDEQKTIEPFRNISIKINEKDFQINVADSVSNYWFTQPFHYRPVKSTTWTVTKLYENNFNVILNSDSGTYKMFYTRRSH